jgi:hypothetical protein
MVTGKNRDSDVWLHLWLHLNPEKGLEQDVVRQTIGKPGLNADAVRQRNEKPSRLQGLEWLKPWPYEPVSLNPGSLATASASSSTPILV